jgi:lysophospholipase L1-like esterase
MKIICIGDSLTHGYKIKPTQAWPRLVNQELNVEVVNKGINGDTTGGMLGRFYYDVIRENPSHVIITGGGNDLIWNVPLSVVRSNVAAMVHQATHHMVVPIIGIPIPFESAKAMENWPGIEHTSAINANLSAYRTWIQRFSTDFSLTSIDFYRLFTDDKGNVKQELYIDGLHPTPNGNTFMSNAVVEEFL